MTTILFIDDDPRVPRDWRKILKPSGYRIISALDLPEGMRRAEEGGYDILVTDKNLGGVHRGVRPLLDYMERERPFVPVIIHSGEPGTSAKKELYCTEFTSKADPMRLIEVLDDITGVEDPYCNVN